MDNLGDIGSILGPILSDPSAMEFLYETAESLGLGALLRYAQTKTSDPEQPSAQEAPKETTGQSHGADRSDSAPGADILSSVMRLAPLLSSIKKEDDSTRLLSALRPFLSDERAKRIDEAEKLMTLLRVVTLLREADIPGGII